MSDRRNVMSSLIQSRDIQNAIKEEIIRSNITPSQAEQKAIGYMNEIVSDYSPSSVRVFDRGLAWLWTQLYDGVEVHNLLEPCVNWLKNTRLFMRRAITSHIDYLL